MWAAMQWRARPENERSRDALSLRERRLTLPTGLPTTLVEAY